MVHMPEPRFPMRPIDGESCRLWCLHAPPASHANACDHLSVRITRLCRKSQQTDDIPAAGDLPRTPFSLTKSAFGRFRQRSHKVQRTPGRAIGGG
jgi:hypothetical protein